ncbi:MerC domain-containing protein [Lewinella sp. IMCC34183]|uniref:MerC domain-containing protein n=1 Tax=Lewinella sp. IMCC34183 TaxID=2248762 RepID=UPI000E24CAFE|nr:MerC domain-containing protein [Lewinella sp. IMCC34183]
MSNRSTIARSPHYDWVGVTAGVLCAIHCVLTPFVAALVPVLADAGGWWGMLDIAFLLISLFAVVGLVRSTSLRWLRRFAPLSWITLALGLAGERYGLAGGDYIMYLGAAGLLVAHVVNLRNCRRCHYRAADA